MAEQYVSAFAIDADSFYAMVASNDVPFRRLRDDDIERRPVNGSPAPAT